MRHTLALFITASALIATPAFAATKKPTYVAPPTTTLGGAKKPVLMGAKPAVMPKQTTPSMGISSGRLIGNDGSTFRGR